MALGEVRVGKQLSTQLGFDLMSLNAFLAVYRTGSMSAAAREVGLTQSGVSRQIAVLERSFGGRLFERASRPLKATTAGRNLAVLAEKLLNDAASLPGHIRAVPDGMIPQLRLGLVDSLSDPLVPVLIKSLRERVSSISVTTGFLETLRRRFLAHEIDAVISPDPFDDLDGFERFPLLKEEFVVIAPRGEPPFGDEAEFRRFASIAPLIRSGAATAIAQRVEQHFRRLKLQVPHSFTCDTIESIVSLVAAGIGWSILTPVCVRKCLALTPAIQVLPLPGPKFSRQLFLVVRQNELGPFARQLAATCRKAFAKSYLPPLVAIAPWMKTALLIATDQVTEAFD